MTRRPSRLLRRLRFFATDTRGSVSVETAVMMPFLLGLFALSFVWYDAFRAKNEVLKATYTVADMISREQVSLPESYFQGLTAVFDFMTRSGDPSRLRITTVKCTEDCGDPIERNLVMCWSWASTGFQPHTAETFTIFEPNIPLMVLGDTVVVTEGALDYTPLFDRWLDETEMRNTIVTRPRFSPQIAYGTQKCY